MRIYYPPGSQAKAYAKGDRLKDKSDAKETGYKFHNLTRRQAEVKPSARET